MSDYDHQLPAGCCDAVLPAGLSQSPPPLQAMHCTYIVYTWSDILTPQYKNVRSYTR